MTSVEETLHLRIEQKSGIAENICSLSLVNPAGGDLPVFEAGAHLDVHLPSGLVRQYSLCGDPRNRRTYELGVLRDPASRGGSIDVHEALHVGDLVRVSLPKNHFPLDETAASSVLFAGGIGITPILAMGASIGGHRPALHPRITARGRARRRHSSRRYRASRWGRTFGSISTMAPRNNGSIRGRSRRRRPRVARLRVRADGIHGLGSRRVFRRCDRNQPSHREYFPIPRSTKTARDSRSSCGAPI